MGCSPSGVFGGLSGEWHPPCRSWAREEGGTVVTTRGLKLVVLRESADPHFVERLVPAASFMLADDYPFVALPLLDSNTHRCEPPPTDDPNALTSPSPRCVARDDLPRLPFDLRRSVFDSRNTADRH